MRVFHEIRRPPEDDPFGVSANRTRSIAFMAHWHHDIEIILSLGGEIPIGVGGRTHRMREGDIAIAGSGEIHFYEGEPNGCEILIVIIPPGLVGRGCWPMGLRFATPFFTASGDAVPGAVTRVPATDLAVLRRLLLDLEQEVPRRDAAHADVLRGCIHHFLGMAVRLLPTEASTEAGEKRRQEQVMRIQEALEWLESNFRTEVSLEDLARRMNVSYHYLSRLFGETVGTPFKQHLNRLRVNEADRLLAGSTLSITEIALQSGFNSLRTFNRAYRSIRGKTPSTGR